MYSLFKSISFNKINFKSISDLIFSYKFKILVVILSVIVGLINSNLMAQDSLPTLNPGKISQIFTSNPKVNLSSTYSLSKENTTHLKMSYGGYKVLNKENWPKRVEDRRPKVVDIVMTLYPSDTANWRDDFFDLIKNRVLSLYNLDSAFLIDKFIEWNIYLQDNKNYYNGARNQFHGVVVHYQPLTKKKQQDAYKELLHKWDQKRNIKIAGRKLNKIIDRNRGKWNDMLVITDCSGSMIPYGSEVVLWHMLRYDKNNISQFVFFNDGDTINRTKAIGNAGGVYRFYSKKPDKILKAVKYYTDMGMNFNNDVPENDVEAIVKGSEMVEKFKDIVLVADNGSGIRDISIVNQIKKPVRIVLCGVYNGFIHPDYIKLAYETNGSIHTVEQDILKFMKDKDGKIIAINDVSYKIQEDQLVQITKKDK